MQIIESVQTWEGTVTYFYHACTACYLLGE